MAKPASRMIFQGMAISDRWHPVGCTPRSSAPRERAHGRGCAAHRARVAHLVAVGHDEQDVLVAAVRLRHGGKACSPESCGMAKIARPMGFVRGCNRIGCMQLLFERGNMVDAGTPLVDSPGIALDEEAGRAAIAILPRAGWGCDAVHCAHLGDSVATTARRTRCAARDQPPSVAQHLADPPPPACSVADWVRCLPCHHAAVPPCHRTDAPAGRDASLTAPCAQGSGCDQVPAGPGDE